jgi:hypothetical protein
LVSTWICFGHCHQIKLSKTFETSIQMNSFGS